MLRINRCYVVEWRRTSAWNVVIVVCGLFVGEEKNYELDRMDKKLGKSDKNLLLFHF